MRKGQRTILMILCVLALTQCSNRTKKKTTDNDTENAKEGLYNLVWSDEFETDGTPDPSKWTYENGFVRNEELQWYQPKNAFCENGFLIIEGKREVLPNPNYDSNSENWKAQRKEAIFTSASVTTKGLHSWKYGRFEIKAKFKTQPGLWPAIWTLGADQPWPIGGEIDIMEYYHHSILANAAWAGKDNTVWDEGKFPMAHFDDPDWANKFHIWRMDWNENAIKLYLDDELLNMIELSKTINKRGEVKNPFKIPHFMILNLAIGGKAGGDPSGATFPSRYEIDYVRIYQVSR